MNDSHDLISVYEQFESEASLCSGLTMYKPLVTDLQNRCKELQLTPSNKRSMLNTEAEDIKFNGVQIRDCQ